MTEVNSIEFLLPHRIVEKLNKIDSGGRVSWEGRACSGDVDFKQSETTDELKQETPLFKRATANLNSQIRVSATKLHSGLLHLTFDRLKLNVLEGKLCCAVSLEEQFEPGDPGCEHLSSQGDVPHCLADDTDDVTFGEIHQLSDTAFVNPLQGVEPSINLIDHITDTRQDIDKPDVNYTQPVVVKRKRGRPRKVKPPTNCSNTRDVNISTSVDGDVASTETPPKRYSLRGVKLRKDLLDAERNGSDEENDVKETFTKECGTDTMTLDTASTVSEVMVFSEPQLKNSANMQTLKLKNSGNGSQRGTYRRKRNNVRVARCKFCNKMFCDFTGVEEHVRKFHSSDDGFQDYINELKDLKIVKCLQCDLKFKNRYSLQIHEDMAHCQFAGSTCATCKKQYRSLRSLRLHERMVHQSTDKEHLCHLCPAKFKWANTLKQHILEIHDGVQNFQCNFCDKRFCRRGQLNRHLRIHGTDNSKRILCNLCGKGFWYDANLQRHLVTVHQKHTEKYHCSYCGKGFTQKNSMVSHVRLLHFKLHSYVCKHCSMTFPRSKVLEEHMKVAHADHSYKGSDSRRQRFKYNRTADDLFYCTHCSSSFFYKAKMVEHIHKAHANEFPFVCTICDQGFLMRSYLRKHKRAAHGQNEEPIGASDEEEEASRLTLIDSKEQAKSINLGILGDASNQKYASSAFFAMTGNIDDMDDLELSDAAAAASLLVEVASGNMTTHYVIHNPDQVADSVAQPEMMGELSGDQSNVVQIITADNVSTQVVLPSNMDGENYELVEGFTEEAILQDGENITVLSEPVEDTVILADHDLQFEDNMNNDVPLNVVVVESES